MIPSEKIRQAAANRGWTEDTMLSLVLEYLDMTADEETFSAFINEIVDCEEEEEEEETERRFK